jgi:hypothetical protein
VLHDVVCGPDDPDAVRFLVAFVHAHPEVGRHTHLELLRRLVEHVREHEPAGGRERHG